ncbi:MAG: hypothetical protein HQK54_11125 [Oligoflexales bacterium]|nr:hypothetical protein [Oligoflexales bacterium]
MEYETILENLINLANEIYRHLKDISDAYESLVPVLEEELQAFRNSNLVMAEEVIKKKEDIGERILFLVNDLKSNANKIFLIGKEFSIKDCSQNEIGNSLGNVIATLESIENRTKDVGLRNKVLGHIISKLRDEYEKFRRLIDSAKPKIEINVSITKRLLERNYELMRFFQEVDNESSVTYNALGETCKKSDISVLKVRV